MARKKSSDSTGTGHNSTAVFKDCIKKIENLMQERDGLNEDVQEQFAILKTNGFDPKAARIVVRRRRMDPMEREKLDDLVKIYEGPLS